MKYTPLLLILLFCSACASYVQVFKTKSTTLLKSETGYTFENDTVRIVYDFWAEHGVLSFTVYNKLNIPLYIDWKKSSFIRNDQKISYYIDVEKTNTETDYKNLLYSYSYWGIIAGVSSSTSVKTKPERITFIAPHSEIKKNQFYLLNVNGVILGSNIKDNLVKSSMDTSKTVSVYCKFYKEPKESILNFRNFLTFSTTEDFKAEFYADNDFFVSKATETKMQQFQGKVVRKVDEFNSYYGDYSFPYRDSTSFYLLNVPVEYTVKGSGDLFYKVK